MTAIPESLRSEIINIAAEVKAKRFSLEGALTHIARKALESAQPEARRTIPVDDNMIRNAEHAKKVGMSRVTMSVPVDWILGGEELPQGER